MELWNKLRINKMGTKKSFLNENFSILLIFLGILLLLISIILFFWRSSGFSFDLPINTEKFNHFGSFVSGIIGTTWSLAGVILFYVALKEQRKDYKTNQVALNTQIQSFGQQVREYELQRQELEQTRNVLIEQSKTLKIQQFESTFFNSLNLLSSITQNINFTKSPSNFNTMILKEVDNKDYIGKNCFEFFYKELERKYKMKYKSYITSNLKQTYKQDEEFNVPFEIHRELANESYEEIFSKYQAALGHYFRTLYNIIRLVKNQNPENSKYYTNLVRAQLSTYEHLLLFYNCFSEYGEERFKPLIIEFSLLDNMPINKLIDEKHIDFYPKEAYK